MAKNQEQEEILRRKMFKRNIDLLISIVYEVYKYLKKMKKGRWQ
jgi:hypothetical protein